MQKFKKIFLISCLAIILSTSFSLPSKTYAANIFGFNDPSGCESNDLVYPSVVICGRNPASGACSQYTQPCDIADLTNTAFRLFILYPLITALLILPILIIYYGGMIIWHRDITGKIFDMKEAKKKLVNIFIYFILMLAAWLIVRTIVDIFQVDDRINTFMIDENGQTVKARQFNTN